MRTYFALILTLVSVVSINAQVPITSLGTPYTQDFDSLAVTGTSSIVPAGWSFLETGTNANSTYTAGTGSSNAGDTYSFGAADTTERAFGGLQSGSLVPTVGAAFVNSTGSAITSLTIAYTGEQWRLGTAGRVDRIDFQYSLNATDLSTGSGTWVDVNELDFSSPFTSTVGARDGNDPANRTALAFAISGLNIPNGATFRIRWASFDAAGADDGLAVDDFSLTANGAAGSTPTLSINDVTASETNTGTTNFVFNVSLSSPAGAGGVAFDIVTGVTGTATSGDDYLANALTGQTIAEGSSTYLFTVQVIGDMTIEPDETFHVNVTNVVGASVVDGQGLGTILNDDVAPVTITAIHTIQGPAIQSTLTGQNVTTEGIVTALISNGFFLQTPDASADADPGTSQGIFVFTSAAPPTAAAVGNFVRVAGTVTEFRPATDLNSRPITELTTPTVTLLSTGNPLPTPIEINTAALTAAGGPDQLERFEGMRVSAASLTVVAPTDGNVNEPSATAATTGVLYAVLPGAPLPMREAGIEIFDTPANPGTACAAGAGCAIPSFDANPERIRLDTDAAGQPAVDVNTGAILTNVAGVLHYAFRAYTILPTSPIMFGGTPITVTAAPVPPTNAVTIAAMNVERLFDTVDDPGVSDVVVEPAAFNGRLGKISQAVRNLLRTPDVVALEEVENLSTAQALAARINSDAAGAGDPNPGYSAFLVEGRDIGGIDVAFLARSEITASVTQLGFSATYTDPCTGLQATLNDRPPLRLMGSATKGGQTLAFTVFVNHSRSLNGIADTTPCAMSTDGNRVRTKRAAQANFLAQLVEDELTANPSSRIILVGDFNAFEVNDGYADSINAIMGTPAPLTQVTNATVDPTYPNMTNLLSRLPRAQQYSYVFDGNHQTLDHAILNPPAMSQFVGGGYVRVNADFNETFRRDFNRPERYSDHDPVYVSLTTAQNVTAQTSMVRTGVIYHRAALTATSSVRITNNTSSSLSGPLQLVITGLPDGVRLTNANSTTPSSATFNLVTPLAPGQTVTVPLAFALNAIKAISYNASVFMGTSGPF